MLVVGANLFLHSFDFNKEIETRRGFNIKIVVVREKHKSPSLFIKSYINSAA